MTTTTSYGTWAQHTTQLTVESGVRDALGEFVNDYNVEALTEDYRAAVDIAVGMDRDLPEGISLRGDEFYGPHPRPSDLHLTAAIEAADFWSIAAKHEKR